MEQDRRSVKQGCKGRIIEPRNAHRCMGSSQLICVGTTPRCALLSQHAEARPWSESGANVYRGDLGTQEALRLPHKPADGHCLNKDQAPSELRSARGGMKELRDEVIASE